MLSSPVGFLLNLFHYRQHRRLPFQHFALHSIRDLGIRFRQVLCFGGIVFDVVEPNVTPSLLVASLWRVNRMNASYFRPAIINASPDTDAAAGDGEKRTFLSGGVARGLSLSGQCFQMRLPRTEKSDKNEA